MLSEATAHATLHTAAHAVHAVHAAHTHVRHTAHGREAASGHGVWGRHNGSRALVHTTHSREHHAHVHTHIEGTVGSLFSLSLFLLLNLLGVLLDTLDLVAEITYELDEVRHDVLLKATPPADFHSYIGLDQLVAVVEHGTDEFLVLPRHDESEELFSENRVLRLGNGLHGILVQIILLGQLDRLLVLLHFAVKKSGDAAALKELVALETDGKVD